MAEKRDKLTQSGYNLLFVSIISSTVYIVWRIFFTLPLDQGLLSAIMGIALVAAEGLAVIEAIFHHRNMRMAVYPEKPEIPDSMYPDVDVMIATHSEDPELLYKTINGCIHMRYPDKSKVHVYLCDDSDRPEMCSLARQMGVGYFGLSGNKEAKAGNLNNALAQTDSPLVVTLDSDMIPTSEFLMETVPYFSLPEMIKRKDGSWRLRTEDELKETKDFKIGFIQTPQSFYNADMFQFNLFAETNVPNEQDYFFREINVGRNRTNSVVYAGSNTVISRKALDEVGGIQTGTITEDFATGMNIQSKGYTCYAIDKVVAHGLAPKDIKGLIKQRQRWARGCVQTMRGFKFMFGPLSFGAKISYLSCYMYWWAFARRLVYILSPIMFAVFGITSVKCTLWEIALIWLPSYVIYNLALKAMSGNIRNQRWSNLADTILFPYIIIPVAAESLGIRMRKFAVTPKTQTSFKNSHLAYAAPHITLAVYSVIGLFFCIRDIIVMKSLGGVIIAYWLAVNLYFLMMAIIFYSGRINYRNDERYYAKVSVTVKMYGLELKGETADLSEGGMSVLLATPEYLPYETTFPVTLTYMDYTAEVEVKSLHVVQAGDKWKYSLRITGCTEENRREYLQIVYDREHTLAKSIKTGLLADSTAPIKGFSKQTEHSNRKLPRIPMNQTMRAVDGREVTCLDFNYEYILLGAAGSMPENMTIAFDRDIFLNCARVRGMGDGKGVLYRIEGWRDISMDPRFRKRLLGLIGRPDEASGYGLKQALVGGVEYV